MYICVSGGSEADSVAFENESFVYVGEVERPVWDVAFGDVAFFFWWAEEITILWNWKDSFTLRVNESYSAVLR